MDDGATQKGARGPSGSRGRSGRSNAPINVKPERRGGGVGHRVRILTFEKKLSKSPPPGKK